MIRKVKASGSPSGGIYTAEQCLLSSVTIERPKKTTKQSDDNQYTGRYFRLAHRPFRIFFKIIIVETW
ncbi:hypothetical protein BJV82DRAFT_591971 [Fennellomyces sp. T-0311]|nr:hypothetical protein BJV82DRAFT_591971 [Fennellomyces sp. T-0311]